MKDFLCKRSRGKVNLLALGLGIAAILGFCNNPENAIELVNQRNLVYSGMLFASAAMATCPKRDPFVVFRGVSADGIEKTLLAEYDESSKGGIRLSMIRGEKVEQEKSFEIIQIPEGFSAQVLNNIIAREIHKEELNKI